MGEGIEEEIMRNEMRCAVTLNALETQRNTFAMNVICILDLSDLNLKLQQLLFGDGSRHCPASDLVIARSWWSEVHTLQQKD